MSLVEMEGLDCEVVTEYSEFEISGKELIGFH
jgi:hypothetical protein